jgi:hypothetical protein
MLDAPEAVREAEAKGRKAERACIVEWLRGNEDFSGDKAVALECAADIIECWDK